MKAGDKVSLIDEDLTGIVKSVKGDLVIFTDEFGFSHEYQKKELVVQDAGIYEGLKTIQKSSVSKPVSKKHSKNRFVLDLHFENLADNSRNYDAAERLFIQKEKLREAFEFCRKNRIKTLEIVHGIGDGILQKMVHDFLIAQIHIDFEQDDFFYHSTGTVVVRFR